MTLSYKSNFDESVKQLLSTNNELDQQVLTKLGREANELEQLMRLGFRTQYSLLQKTDTSRKKSKNLEFFVKQTEQECGLVLKKIKNSIDALLKVFVWISLKSFVNLWSQQTTDHQPQPTTCSLSDITLYSYQCLKIRYGRFKQNLLDMFHYVAGSISDSIFSPEQIEPVKKQYEAMIEPVVEIDQKMCLLVAAIEKHYKSVILFVSSHKIKTRICSIINSLKQKTLGTTVAQVEMLLFTTALTRTSLNNAVSAILAAGLSSQSQSHHHLTNQLAQLVGRGVAEVDSFDDLCRIHKQVLARKKSFNKIETLAANLSVLLYKIPQERTVAESPGVVSKLYEDLIVKYNTEVAHLTVYESIFQEESYQQTFPVFVDCYQLVLDKKFDGFPNHHFQQRNGPETLVRCHAKLGVVATDKKAKDKKWKKCCARLNRLSVCFFKELDSAELVQTDNKFAVDAKIMLKGTTVTVEEVDKKKGVFKLQLDDKRYSLVYCDDKAASSQFESAIKYSLAKFGIM